MASTAMISLSRLLCLASSHRRLADCSKENDMNPFGFVLIGIGILLVIIGFKGSQHTVLDAIHPSSASKS